MLIFGISGCDKNERVIEILEVGQSQYSGDGNEILQQKKTCFDWKLNRDQVKNILIRAKPITEQERHQLYYYLPCEISGKAKISNKLTNFQINAAAFLTLESEGEITYAGCEDDTCFSFFLIKNRGLE